MENKVEKELREIINKKLVEYDSFFDEEMSKYIMVLIANKKTKEQVEKDLELFLGKNSRTFSNWLYELLGQGYKQATNASNNVAEPKKKEKTRPPSPGSEDEDVLAIDAMADDFLNTDFQDETSKKARPQESLSKGGRNALTESHIHQENAKTATKHHFVQQSSMSPRSFTNSEKSRHQPTPKRFKHDSIDDEEEEEEYDPLNPSLKSVIRKRAPDVQPNHLLLLRAVEEANKSIVGKDQIDEIYRPTPIKVLVSAARKKSHYREKPVEVEPLPLEANDDDHDKPQSSTPLHTSILYKKNESSHNGFSTRRNLLPIPTEPMLKYKDDFSLEKRVHYTKFHGDHPVQSDAEFLDEDDIDITDTPPNNPTRFVVTLNGLDSNSLKRKRDLSPASSEATDDYETARFKSHYDDSQETMHETFSLAKMSEKCKFWPSCKNGDSCTFYHPSSLCNTFPNCKFGDKCFYIHPNCKFDAMCSKRGCPFTHNNKRDAFLVSRPGRMYAKASYKYGKMPLCKFHPFCSSLNCFFFHPKKCRFGFRCSHSSCPFVHPYFPPRQQLKWEAMPLFRK